MEGSQFIFTTPFNVNVVEVKGKEKVFMEGLISTTDQDLVNDIVTKKCLESMQKQILDRSIKLDIEHEAFRGDTVEEKELNKTKVPAGKINDATVRETENGGWGLMVKSELNNFRNDFENVKGNVIERYLDAYSIAFIPTEISMKNINGEEVRLLDDVRLLNVALTGNPINTQAQNRDVFMKSIDAVEEYKNEKKNDPELENKLEVKGKPTRSAAATQARNQAISETDEEEDEEKKKKKPQKKTNHIHASDNKLNYRRLNMEEDKDAKPEESTEEATEDVEESSEETKDEEAAEEDADAESSEGDAEEKSELKALKDTIEKQGKELAEIKAILKKPVHKALADPNVKDVPANQKEVNPLDAIA